MNNLLPPHLMGGSLRHPHLPSSPPLAQLQGDEIFFAVETVRQKRHALDRNEAFGTYSNSITINALKAFMAPIVCDRPPAPGHEGDMWWNPALRELRLFHDGNWDLIVAETAFFFSDKPPVVAHDKDLWWDTSVGRLFVRFQNQWVDTSYER